MDLDKPRYKDLQKGTIFQEAEKKALVKNAPLQLKQLSAKAIHNDVRFRPTRSPDELVSNGVPDRIQQDAKPQQRAQGDTTVPAAQGRQVARNFPMKVEFPGGKNDIQFRLAMELRVQSMAWCCT